MKSKKIAFGLMTCATLLTVSAPIFANADNTNALRLAQSSVTAIPASGTFGTAHWELDTSGVLTVHSGKFLDITTGTNPWSRYRDSITKIVFDGDVVAAPESHFLFSSLPYVTSIEGLSKLDTSQVTDMKGMFSGTIRLTSLDLSNFDTSNVTNMASMFFGSGVTSLDLSNFDTRRVTDMNRMFSSTIKLTSLDLSNFDTSNVTNMASMFFSSGVTSLDLSSFYTGHVLDMSDMFNEATGLTSLNLSNFDTRRVTRADDFLLGTQLTKYEVGPYVTSIVSLPDLKELNVKDIVIQLGSAWKVNDNFVSAKDRTGTSLDISNITVTNNVDTNKVGTYEAHYKYDGLEKIAKITVEKGTNSGTTTPDPGTTTPEWHHSVTYKKGDRVTYNGKIYEALVDFTDAGDPNWSPEIAHTLWQIVDLT